MPKPRVNAGGGWAAIAYSLRKGRDTGGIWKLYRRLRARNACKTCAFGMGGQRGGMVNEHGSFPEVCKKSVQAQAGDMQRPVPDDFFERHPVAELERWTPLQMEHAGRLTYPVLWEHGDTHFRRVKWDEAMRRLAGALLDAPPAETFFYASGRSSNEVAFLLQTLARAYGTRNIHNCSSYCHQASGVALTRIIGSGTATVLLDDLDETELALVVGANPASNHPRLIVKLVELRRRGGKVIVINPVRELGLTRFRIPSSPGSLLFGSDVCDLYLQPHVGSDIAVFKALLKSLLERGDIDYDFLRDHVDGFDEVIRDVEASGWDTLLTTCGLTRDEIDRAAVLLAGARRGMALWAMGLTHHTWGVDNVSALANLVLARGWLGRSGCGLMPIRGHSNVQGVGSVGFTPALKQAFADKMKEVYGVEVAGEAGLDTYKSMQAAHNGQVRVAVLLGGNLWGSNPDLEWAAEAMRRIGTTAMISTKLNPGHVHGRGRCTMILPCLARDEEPQATTQESMFNFVRLSDGGAARPGTEVRSEVEIVCDLADRLLPDGPVPFREMKSHAAIREAIAKVVPGYDAIGGIDGGGAEFQIAGRTFHEPRFNTPNGKAQAQSVALPEFGIAADEFRLMTLRSEGQFNTVVYEEEDLYRGVSGRDAVMMSLADGQRLKLYEGERVAVSTATGRMEASVAFIDIPAGNLAMYYPEANVLVPRRVDAASGTPAFKSIVARIERL